MSQYQKFVDEFGNDEDSEDGGDSEDEGGASKRKPDDWKAQFDQNVDDDFKFGFQINPGQGKGSGADKGAYMRLYSDFFLSDVIVASPLGLRLVVEGSSGIFTRIYIISVRY